MAMLVLGVLGLILLGPFGLLLGVIVDGFLTVKKGR